MANVYISFLGTNDYVECIYRHDGFEPVGPVRFVQEATIRNTCRDWGYEDRILIFATREAERKNWLDNGHRTRDGQILERDGLEKCITRMNLPVPHQKIDILEGYTEDEIWEIFKRLNDCLNQGDSVIFDITHALRSIPLLAMTVLNYAKSLKQVRIEGIYYGAFEALGSIEQVKAMKVEERKVRILDLTALDRLMDWTVATDRFIYGGDARMVGALAKTSVREILRETRGQDVVARTIRGLGDALELFTWAVATCRGPDITDVTTKLKDKVRACRDLNLLPPFRSLFETMETRLQPFTGQTLKDGLAAVRWCLNHNLIQQGFTILQETLISFVLEETGGDILDLDQRTMASYAFKIANERLSRKARQSGTQPSSADKQSDPEALERTVRFIQQSGILCREVARTIDPRNDLNHAGFRKEKTMRASKAPSFGDKLRAILDAVEDLIPQ